MIRLALALVVAVVALGCEPLASPGNDPARIVSVGPVRATDDGVGVELAFAVHDDEGDAVELEVTVCRPAHGERCATGAPACESAVRLEPPGQPVTLHGDPDPTSLTVHTVAWHPGCQPRPPEPSTELALCLRPRDGAPLGSPTFTLTSLGLAPGETTPATPCP